MQLDNLPPEWLKTKLGDVVDYGKSQKCELSDVSDTTWILELEDIEKESSKIVQRLNAAVRPFKSTKNKFKKGDVLYGKLRPYLNKVIIADQDGVCSTEIIPLDAEPHVDNRYLFHWIKSEAFLNYVIEVSYGVNMPRLGTQDGLSAPFDLPPLAEQKVIAEKLDTLLAQVASTKARLERIPEILKSFRQSVLAAAVSGKLTEEWRCVGVKDWKTTQLSKICRSVSDGDHQAPPRADAGIPFLVISNVSKGEIELDTVSRWVPNDYYEALKPIRKPEMYDILYTVTGSFGIPAVVKSTLKFCFQRHIAIIKPDHSKVNYKYLSYYLGSPEVLKYADSVATGTAQKTVSLSHLRNFEVSLPPLEEQTEIVRRVEELFTYADRIEKSAQAALTRVNNLTQSILAKAFRGELTMEWRTANPELISGDNSAEALLAKIKAERATLAGNKRGRKAAIND